MKTKKDGKVRFEIADHGLSAIAIIEPPENGGAPVTMDILKDEMAKERITFGIHHESALASGVARGRKNYARFEVARGRMPGVGQDAYLDMFWARNNPKADHEHDGDVDHREMGIVDSVNSEEIIARKVDASKGTHGITVSGDIITGTKGKDRTFIAGKNVESLHNGAYFKSLISGVPRVSGNIISVHPVYIVDGNVDFAVGNINFSGTVIVKGSIIDGFTVSADEDIYVKGNIDGAYVTAGGNVEVHGGILTRYSGYVVAGKNVYSRYIRNSIVEAEGNIYAGREIVDSFVRANGSISCSHGDGRITGGDVMAREEIIARQLGSKMETATVLRVGMNFKTYLLIKETEQALQHAEFELRDVEKSILTCGAKDADTLAELKAKQLELIEKKNSLKSEINALAEMDEMNYGATVKCECDAYTGVVVYIGENAKRIRQKTKHVMFQCDEDFTVRLGFRFESGAQPSESKAPRYNRGPEANREKVAPAGAPSPGVVLVDNSEFTRKKAGYILNAEGVEVLADTGNIEEAIELTRKLRPAVVMIDVKSLNGDSDSIVKNLKEASPETNLVLMVGTTVAPELVRSVMKYGPVNFMLKPLHREHVSDVLCRVLAPLVENRRPA